MGVIYGLSAQPVLPGSEVFWQDFLLKKCAHIGFYLLLFWAWFIAAKKNGWAQTLTTKGWLLLILACFLFALSDEYHQSLVPGRTARIRDVGFDLLGVGLGFLWSYRLIG
jgi:VanZ family protein